jgi:hypothetical protein
MGGQPFMQVVPILRAVDRIEHVRAGALVPREFTALAQLPIRTVA